VVTAKWYGQGARMQASGQLDWDNAGQAIKAMLVTASYTPDQDAHDFRDDLGANECSGTGYTAGGVAIANRSLNYVGASNKVQYLGDPLSWTGLDLGTAARYIVIYIARGGAASADELIGWVDLGADIDPGGLDFTYTPHADGYFLATVAA
jgi:hypothetical protein